MSASSQTAAVRRLERLWPELVILGAVALAFAPTLIGSGHLPYDAEFFHYPLLRTVQESLSSGTLPAWDSFTYGGVPLLANAQSAWLYPPHLLLDGALAVLGQPLTEHAMDVLVVLHIAVAGIATSAVVRGRGLGKPAAAFAGTFVAVSGATVSQVQHVLLTETFAWLPLAVLFVDRLALGVTARRLIGLGASFALMITAGFLPAIPAVAAALLAIAVVRASGRWSASLGAIAGMSLGAVMASAMLLPVAALLGTYPPLPAHGSVPVSYLLTSVLPDAFGHWQASAQALSGPGDPTTSYFYIGAAGIVLLPLALTSGRAALLDAVPALVLLLASFGAVAAKVATVVQSLPSVGLLWRPEDVAYVATVPLALLLARGLSRAPSRKQLWAAAAMLALLAMIPFAGGRGIELHVLPDAPWQQLLGIFLTGAAVLAATICRARFRRGTAIALATAAVIGAIELAAAVPGRYFINSQGPATSAGPQLTGTASIVLSDLEGRLRSDERVGADLDNLPPSWSGFSPIWHLPIANGFQPQFSKYQLARVLATGADFHGRNRIFPIIPAVHPYLDEMNARYVVVSAKNDPFGAAQLYTSVFRDAIYHVYRVGGRLERAYGVDQACLQRRGANAIDACRIDNRAHVAITGPATRRITIDGTGGVPSLVVGEPWYPGWEATSSSGSLPVHRVGYLAAVKVPAGVSKVELSYHPPGLLIGGILSLLAVTGSLLMVWRTRRPARTGPDGPASA